MTKLPSQHSRVIKMAFGWRTDDDPLIVLFGSSDHKKNVAKLDPDSGKTHEISSLIFFKIEVKILRKNCRLCESCSCDWHYKGLIIFLLEKKRKKVNQKWMTMYETYPNGI